MGKPTVHDIAKEAGVSLATVDRVLNARPGVRQTTVDRVQSAITRLGYVRDAAAANLARRKHYRFAFVLPEGRLQFVETLRRAIGEAIEGQRLERVSAKIIGVAVNDPHAIARSLRALDPGRWDGVAVMVPETPQVRDAIVRLKDAGLPVVTMATDLPNTPRDFFAGINNHRAGRTAGGLIGRFTGRSEGQVLAVTNSLQARDSLERRLGFDEVIGEEFPRLVTLPTLESHNDADRMAQIVQRRVAARPDIVAVYSMGAGNAALLRGLRASGRLDDLIVVAHELTPVTRQALLDGDATALITQHVGHLVRSALRVLRARSDGTPIFEAQERIRTDILIKENLP